MSHRRRPSRSTIRPTAAGSRGGARPFRAEQLEVRRLLAVVGATFSGSGEQTFADGGGAPSVITWNDVTFQVIPVTRQVAATSATSPLPVIEPKLQSFPIPTTPTGQLGTDIFKIYVTESAADAYVSITHYAANPGGGIVHLTPFDAPALAGVVNQAGAEASELPGVGGILIGGVEFGPGGTTGRPDLFDTITVPPTAPLGLQPYPAGGMLEAGIQVIPTNAATGLQNDFGRLFVAGDVTGHVSFGGNVDEFYAGGIYTGLSTGGTDATATVITTINGTGGPPGGGTTFGNPNASSRLDPGNFAVAGDLRELLSAGPVGTDGVTLPAMYGNADNDPALLNYVSDVDLTVGGTLGEVHLGNQELGFTNATFAGTIEVAHSSVVSGESVLPAGDFRTIGDTFNQTEVENLAPAFPQDLFSGTVEDFGGGGFVSVAPPELDFPNNTPGDAQILGSIPEINPQTGTLLRDAQGNLINHASVDGLFQGAADGGDSADYYGMAMLAGSTFTVALSGETPVSLGAVMPAPGAPAVPTPGTPAIPEVPVLPVLTPGTADEELFVYDPDGRLIASNVLAQGGAIRITADRPGIYHFEVTDSATAASFYYNLSITNSGDLATGGIVINGNYDDLGFDGSLSAATGDFGCLDVTGTYFSIDAGPTPTGPSPAEPLSAPSSIVVADGNLRALIGGALGEASFGDPRVYIDGPYFNIPAGGLGLVQTTGGLLDFNSQFDPNYLAGTTLATSRFVTDDAYAHAIAGPIQVIDSAGSFQGFVATDAGIGSIRAADLNTDEASYIDVNADNLGNDGIIDLIDCEGQLGNLGAGGPSIVTHTGGQVRYMQVAGAVFLPQQFGTLEDQAVSFPIGTGTTFTDDAGNRITVTPIGVTTTTTVAGVTTTGTTSNTSGGSTTSNTSNGSTTVTFSPAPGEEETQVTDTATGAITTTTTTGPQLSMLSYPVADKGGQIPLNITSTGSLDISAVGNNGSSSEVDLNSVTIAGLGRPLIESGVDQFGNVAVLQPVPAAAATTTTGTGTTTGTTTTTTASTAAASALTTNQSILTAGTTDPTDLFLLLTGSAKVNVLNVTSVGAITGFVGTGSAVNNGTTVFGVTGQDATITAPSTGVPVEIFDGTPGEIVSLNSPGVGTIQVRGNLGFATPAATPAAILPRPVIAGGNSYPFVQQHTGVELTSDTTNPGDAVNINVQGALGNIQSSGTIENLVADYGNRPTPGLFAGIVGPVVATRLLFVQVGQGLASTGTGSVGLAGLFATDKVGEVTNGGIPDGDIRGNIVTLGIGNTTNSVLDHIQLGSASIIGSTIAGIGGTAYLTTGAAFSTTSLVGAPPTVLLEVNGNPVAAGRNSQYDIGTINITGDGGILGSVIEAGSIAPVTVGNGGFGVLHTTLAALSGGRVGGITAAGYGIREDLVDNGGFVGPLSATGNGSLLPVTNFPTDLRPSDVQGQAFDPFTGDPANYLNDLDAALGSGVSATTPNLPDVTDTGAFEDNTVAANNDVVGISAQTARVVLPLLSPTMLPTPSAPNIPVIGTPFLDSITTGGAVGYVRIRGLIDGLQITAGSLGQFTQSGDANRLGIDIAGTLSSLLIRGTLGAVITDPATGLPIPDSYVEANGRNGNIGNLTVDGSSFATIYSSGHIGNVTVRGNLAGNITNAGMTAGHLGLNSLTVGGAIESGSLNIAGDVGTILTGGGLGAVSESLTITGGINRLIVGSPRSHGSALNLDLTVDGTVKSLAVNGIIRGNVHVLGDVRTLRVTDDGSSPNAVSGNVQIDGRLYNATIANGNLASTLAVNGDIGDLTLNRGSLGPTGTIASILGTIRNLSLIGGTAYGLDGAVLARDGDGVNINDTGNIGDGVNRATIAAVTAGTIRVGGSVLNNADVAFSGLVNQLLVSGSVAAGATVAGHPIRTHRVTGTVAGTLITA